MIFGRHVDRRYSLILQASNVLAESQISKKIIYLFILYEK